MQRPTPPASRRGSNPQPMARIMDAMASSDDDHTTPAQHAARFRVGGAPLGFGALIGLVLSAATVAGLVLTGVAPTTQKSAEIVPEKTVAPVETPAPIPTEVPGSWPRKSLAPTPPMGWNSWNQVSCDGLNEAVVMAAADNIVARGLKDAGYEYVVVDDCFQAGRDADGTLLVAADRFPNGMKHVADYVHGLGLKFGIYAVPGSVTCGNYWSKYPVKGIGSLGHEAQDVALFVEWGVDFLKYDWCRAQINDKLDAATQFTLMNQVIKDSGRRIVLSVSEYGDYAPWTWAPGVANMWRTTHDIHPNWASILKHINLQAPLAGTSSPGAWNDPDMLQIGNGLSPNETNTHFAMWCMLAAPLFLGTDIGALPPETIALLTNPELLAIDKDRLGIQAHRVSDVGGRQVWMRPLHDGSFAVALLNTNSAATSMSATLAELEIPAGSYTLRDATAQTDLGAATDTLSATVAPHGTVVFVVTPA